MRSLSFKLNNLKRTILFFTLILFVISHLNSQTIKRVEVKGVILSATNEVEAVTVFNKSSNRGTITDEKGFFLLEVALNDIIEITALQFQTVTVTIDAPIIKSNTLKIQLIEQVNQLDAVTLSSGLTGNLGTDTQNVKFVKIKPIDLGNLDALIMSEDKVFDRGVIQDHLEATLNPNARFYQPDLVKILRLFFKSNKKSVSQKNNDFDDKKKQPKSIYNVYSHQYISEAFNMPSEQVEGFIAFIQNGGIDLELLKPENEIVLIEFLNEQKGKFLKLKNVKN